MNNDLCAKFIWDTLHQDKKEHTFKNTPIEYLPQSSLNLCQNLIDRHLPLFANKKALIFEPNDTTKESSCTYTYSETLSEISKYCYAFQSIGLHKGDKVLCMLEKTQFAVFSILALCRMGCPYICVSVNEGDESIAHKIRDLQPSYILCINALDQGTTSIQVKYILDNILLDTPEYTGKVIVYKKSNDPIKWNTHRDINWQTYIEATVQTVFPPTYVSSEHPLFISYTSGSTGKPKGLVHTTAGIMIQAYQSFQEAFHIQPKDIIFNTSGLDIINGNTYMLFAPLLHGITTLIYEGVASYPTPDRYWHIIKKWKITIFYTAPITLKILYLYGSNDILQTSLASLRTIATTGNFIPYKVIEWLKNNIHKNSRVSFQNTYWQTETGSIALVSNLPESSTNMSIGRNYKSLSFYDPVLLTEDGQEIKENNQIGRLCFKKPWPSIARTIYGNHELYTKKYFESFKGYYDTHDFAKRDIHGDYILVGRKEDVFQVEGEVYGSMELEQMITELEFIIDAVVYKETDGLFIFVTSWKASSHHLEEEIEQVIHQKIKNISIYKIFWLKEMPRLYSGGKIQRALLRNRIEEEKINNHAQLSDKISLQKYIRYYAHQTPDQSVFSDGEDNVSYKQALQIFYFLTTQAFIPPAETRVALWLSNSIDLALLILFLIERNEIFPLSIHTSVSACEDKFKDFHITYLLTMEKYLYTETIQKIQQKNKDIKILALPNNWIQEGKNYMMKQMLPFEKDYHKKGLLLNTSGTTAKSKKIRLTMANLYASAHNISKATQLTHQDIGLCVIPMTHLHALGTHILAPIITGSATVIMHPEFHVIRFFDFLDRCKITWYSAVPSIHLSIAQRGQIEKESHVIVHHLRFIRSASATLSVDLQKQLQDIFQVPIIQVYAMSEAAQITSQLLDKKNTHGSVGYPFQLDLKILNESTDQELLTGEVGEVSIAGDNVFEGYEEMENKDFTSEGYFRTGDLGYLNENGELFIISRKKEIINKGGVKINMLYVEKAVATHPLVKAVICFAVADAYYGEGIGLGIIPQENSHISLREMQNWIESKLSRQEVPRDIYLLSEIPMGNLGKRKRIGLELVLKEKGHSPITDEESYTSLSSISLVSNMHTKAKEILHKATPLFEAELSIVPFPDNLNFFSAGMDSMMLMRVTQQLNKLFSISWNPLQLMKNNTLSQLAIAIEKDICYQGYRHTEDKYLPFSFIDDTIILPCSKELYEDIFPTTALQSAMIYEQQTENPLLYQMVSYYAIHKPFHSELFIEIWNELVRKHATLRMEVFSLSSTYWIRICKEKKIYPTSYTTYIHEKLADIIPIEHQKVFLVDHEATELYRVAIHIASLDSFHIILVNHHLLWDGFSKSQILEEFTDLYIHKKQIQPISSATATLGNLVWKEKQAIQNKTIELHWKNLLNTYTPTYLTPPSYQVVAIKKYKTLEIEIPKNYEKAIKKIASDCSLPISLVYFTAYAKVIALFLNSTEVTINFCLSTRPSDDQYDEVLGLFLNILPFSLVVDESKSIAEQLKTILSFYIEMQAYLYYPYAHIYQMNQRQSLSHFMFNFMDFTLMQSSHENATDKYLKNLISDTPSTSFPFTLEIALDKEQSFAFVTLDTTNVSSLWEKDFSRYFLHSLLSIIEQKAELNIPNEDARILLKDFNATSYIDVNVEKTIHQCFEEQVKRTPHNIAFTCDKESITYQTLNERANQLAHMIKRDFNIQKDNGIALMLDRSPWMIISILAVLKTGAAYCPISIENSISVTQFILEELNPVCMIVDSSVSHQSFSVPLIEVDMPKCRKELQKQSKENIPSYPHANLSLAYIIYTSGTTGKPKGVQIEHKSFLNFCFHMNRAYKFMPKERIFHFFSYTFDPSVEQFFLPLLHGHSIYLESKELLLNTKVLESYLEKNQITDIHVTPSYILSLQKFPSSLRRIVLGAEELQKSTLTYLRSCIPSHIPILNAYGPTETTITSVLNPNVKEGNNIGTPISNTFCYVLASAHRKLLPIGVIGELYIGGMGVSRGYIKREELQKVKFIENPFQTAEEKEKNENGILYATGDKVKWLQDGTIVFLGRTDRQIKYNGYRIEPQQIEQVMLNFKDEKNSNPIIQAFVKTYTDESIDKDYLMLYWTASDTISISILKDYLKEELPAHMMPHYFFPLDSFPITSHGKLDFKKLPTPKDTNQMQQVIEDNITKEGSREKKLKNIFSSLLKQPLHSIPIQESFFHLGGNSILSIFFIIEFQELCEQEGIKVKVSPALLSTHTSIESLLKWMEEQSQEKHKPYDASSIRKDLRLAIVDAKVKIPQVYKLKNTYKKGDMLLLGGLGFVGIHLLVEILKQPSQDFKIYLLVRNKDHQSYTPETWNDLCKERLQSLWKKYDISFSLKKVMHRIIFIQGDISKKRLGLRHRDYHIIASNCSDIINSACWVNHIIDYSTIRSINVKSINEILQLSNYIRCKRIYHISTLGALTYQLTDLQKMLKDSSKKTKEGIHGYHLSKFVADSILMRAQKKGFDIHIFYLGNVTGSSIGNGVSNYERNHFWAWIKGCILLEKFPMHSQSQITCSPVNEVAHIIYSVISQEKYRKQDHIWYVQNPYQMSGILFWEMIQDFGYAIELVRPNLWIKKYIIPLNDTKNPLYLFKEYYEKIWKEDASYLCLPYDTPQKIKIPPICYKQFSRNYVTLLSHYLQYLQHNRFLPSPSSTIYNK